MVSSKFQVCANFWSFFFGDKEQHPVVCPQTLQACPSTKLVATHECIYSQASVNWFFVDPDNPLGKHQLLQQFSFRKVAEAS